MNLDPRGAVQRSNRLAAAGDDLVPLAIQFGVGNRDTSGRETVGHGNDPPDRWIGRGSRVRLRLRHCDHSGGRHLSVASN